MAKKCRHKRLILATAANVVFDPDEEPFTVDKVEPSGFEEITANAIHIHWCPKCNTAQVISIEGLQGIET